MAGPIGKKDPSVIKRLIDQPHRFSFFQAVRLLTAGGGAARLGAPAGSLGTQDRVGDEPIRFVCKPMLDFPVAEILAVRTEPGDDEVAGPQPIRVEVSFWGLIGAVGALPHHYTQLVIDRQRQRDFAMRDFFDLFSHRQLSLFYRAWEKHDVASGFEAAGRRDDPTRDRVRESLLALVGLGNASVRGRFDHHDDVRLSYGGLFADPPNAESLRQMLADYFGVDVEIDSLHGGWLRLPPAEQTRLGQLDGHTALGHDTVIGERVWDAGSKFRIQIGPVDYERFCELMPTGQSLPPLGQLVRGYTGADLDFDVQVVLLAAEIPGCQLGAATDQPARDAPRLGWNTWLASRPMTRDSDDAVFVHDGAPIG